MMSVLIVGPLLLVAVPAALAVDDTPVIAGAWSGSGPAGTTATTTLDGTHGVAEFKYEKNLGVGGGVPLTTWTFQSTAQQAGTVHLGWDLAGLHAWFQRHGRAVDVRERDTRRHAPRRGARRAAVRHRRTVSTTRARRP